LTIPPKCAIINYKDRKVYKKGVIDMNDINSVWVRGREDRDEMVQVLLDNGYQVRIDVDQESENLTGVASYLISFVVPEFSGVSFQAVNEDGKFIERENK